MSLAKQHSSPRAITIPLHSEFVAMAATGFSLMSVTHSVRANNTWVKLLLHRSPSSFILRWEMEEVSLEAMVNQHFATTLSPIRQIQKYPLCPNQCCVIAFNGHLIYSYGEAHIPLA